MIKPCFYSDWLRSKSPKENTRDQVSCPAEQKDTYLQNSDLLEENGGRKDEREGTGGGRRNRAICVHFSLDTLRKNPCFPNQSNLFHAKRQRSHIVCQLCRTDCVARGPFFLLLKKKKPVSGPGIIRAANSYWTSAKGQALCQVIYTYYRI